ncbi:hypothetical protein POM88_032849 [Heracleum sosnowskyi]|uniref:F-box associated beta-propeller type 1 domain-containing protein n=1 Tax=Heracleum sosnowskyi TaxID=360622 RepID=A0AAD8I0F6_9APIA|nr:hypothetical protein POM88_032849 [Heracleum sosnowskyi]
MGEEQNFGAISVAKMNRSLLESASQRSLCFGHNLKINRAPPPPPLPEEIITEEILTRIPLESLLRFRLCCFPYGFGWDSVANDFKLLAIPLRGDDDIVAGVYSCKTDCWTYHKLAPQVTLHLQNCQYWPNVIVKGIPYWKIGFGMVLLKFEFTSKEFKLLTVLSRVRPNYRLVNLNDCLGRIDYLRDGRKGMEVYRYDEECDLWCKMHTINVGISDLIISFPISFKFGGEILFDQNHNLYDPKSNQIKSSDHHGKYVTHGFSYSPSMIVLEGMKPLQT